MTERRTELQIIRCGDRISTAPGVGRLPRPGEWVALEIGYVRGPDRGRYLRCHGVYRTQAEGLADAPARRALACVCGPLTVRECATFRVLPDGKIYDRVQDGADEGLPWWDGGRR